SSVHGLEHDAMCGAWCSCVRPEPAAEDRRQLVLIRARFAEYVDSHPYQVCLVLLAVRGYRRPSFRDSGLRGPVGQEQHGAATRVGHSADDVGRTVAFALEVFGETPVHDLSNEIRDSFCLLTRRP